MSKAEKKAPVWQYETQHVDIILWQYGSGVLDLINSIGGKNLPYANKLVDDKYAQCEKTFKVAPSFKLQFIEGSGKIELRKTLV